MSLSEQMGVGLGGVTVFTCDNRGATVEEIAKRALDKIIYVSDTAPSVIREQAEAYRRELFFVLVFYLKEAVRSDHVTLANKLREAGCPELVHLLDD